MAAATSPRAEEIRRYVELDALSTFVANIAIEVLGKEPSYWLSDDRGSHQDATNALWQGEYEETEGWNLAQAESAALEARIFAWLASSEGRDFCSRQAEHSAKNTEKFIQETRTMLWPDDAAGAVA